MRKPFIIEAAQTAWEWCSVDFYYEKHRAPSKLEKIFFAILTFLDLMRKAAGCKVSGHDLVDADPGDPEVGPQPYIYCRRCGQER